MKLNFKNREMGEKDRDIEEETFSGAFLRLDRHMVGIF